MLAWGVFRTEGGDAEISPGESTSAQADDTLPGKSGMARYTNPLFRVQLEYPGTWVPDSANVPGGSFADPRGREYGYFSVTACCAGATLDDAAKLSAEHKLRPYGEEPEVMKLTLADGEARLILPDESTIDTDRAELIIRYPPLPGSMSDFYAFLVLYGHKDFIRDIASTLRLTNTSPATSLNSPR